MPGDSEKCFEGEEDYRGEKFVIRVRNSIRVRSVMRVRSVKGLCVQGALCREGCEKAHHGGPIRVSSFSFRQLHGEIVNGGFEVLIADIDMMCDG